MIGTGCGILYYQTKNSSQAIRAKALLQQAKTKQLAGRRLDAIALYEQTLSLMKEENSNLGCAKVLSDMAEVQRQLGDIQGAEKSYMESLNHLEFVEHWKSGDCVAPLAGAVWNQIAILRGSDDPTTEHLYIRALSLTITKSQFVNLRIVSDGQMGNFPTPNILDQAAGILYNLGCFYVERGRLKDAEATLVRSLHVSGFSGTYSDDHRKKIIEVLTDVRTHLQERVDMQ